MNSNNWVKQALEMWKTGVQNPDKISFVTRIHLENEEEWLSLYMKSLPVCLVFL